MGGACRETSTFSFCQLYGTPRHDAGTGLPLWLSYYIHTKSVSCMCEMIEGPTTLTGDRSHPP